MVQTPDQFIPAKDSTSTSWIAWYKALKGSLGKADANIMFKKAWDLRGSDDANNDELRSYMKSEGVTIEKDLTESVIDVITSPLDFLKWGSDIGKTLIWGAIIFVFLVMAVVIYFLFNASKNPGQTIGTAAKFAV